jgi:hypothetical protein
MEKLDHKALLTVETLQLFDFKSRRKRISYTTDMRGRYPASAPALIEKATSGTFHWDVWNKNT